MVRHAVCLDEVQVLRIRKLAAERGTSVSAVVRDAVDKHFARLDALGRSLAACGRFRSGTGDVAARHDEYFVDSIMDQADAAARRQRAAASFVRPLRYTP